MAKSHTTRSWSIPLSDSSASCSQFWITALFPIRRLLICGTLQTIIIHYMTTATHCRAYACVLVPTRLPKVRAVCFWPPSFNKNVLYATPWLRCRLRSQIYPSRLMASVTFDMRHLVSLAHRQRRFRVPPPWYCILIIPTKGAIILMT
jgi:hypothetical protein